MPRPAMIWRISPIRGSSAGPDYCGIYIADVLTGTYAFGAIMTALYQRRETGQGQMIDLSMLESMLSLTLSEIQARAVSGDAAGPAVLRPDRDRRRLCQSVDRQRAHLPEPGRRLWPAGLDQRSALCEIPGTASQLGHADRRAGGLVDAADERRGAGGFRPARRAGLALSHGARGADRPAARTPRRAWPRYKMPAAISA